MALTDSQARTFVDAEIGAGRLGADALPLFEDGFLFVVRCTVCQSLFVADVNHADVTECFTCEETE